MSEATKLFIGIDCGATTSKVSAVWANGDLVSTRLRQRPTDSEQGAPAIIEGWMRGVADFLQNESLSWDHVAGMGLAMPGPYLAYGVLGHMPNMPASLEGWHFLDDLSKAVAAAATRNIPIVTANDGLLAGKAEAKYVQLKKAGGVLMLSPGSGLGCSYVNADGQLLSGDHHAAAILGHSPAPYEVLGLPRFSCGCGRDWGCHEAYTSISGLPKLLEIYLPDFPDHKFHTDTRSTKQKVLSLRDLAQDGDTLALHIFDIQAAALGLTVAAGCAVFDPRHIVIGGGLMDPEATTHEFRQRYLEGIRRSAARYLLFDPNDLDYATAQLGELSQAVGAALYAADPS